MASMTEKAAAQEAAEALSILILRRIKTHGPQTRAQLLESLHVTRQVLDPVLSRLQRKSYLMTLCDSRSFDTYNITPWAYAVIHRLLTPKTSQDLPPIAPAITYRNGTTTAAYTPPPMPTYRAGADDFRHIPSRRS